MANPRRHSIASDPLGDALHLMRLTGALYCAAEAGEPWGVTIPELPGHVTLPIVLAGRARLEIDGELHFLETGDAALLTRGAAHRMRSAEGVHCPPLFDLPAEVVSERCERMRIGGDGELTRIAYAVLRVDDPLSARLFAELPPVVRADSWDDDDAGSFPTVLRLLSREAMADRPGGETMMTRLADVLVIMVVRRWLRSREVPQHGWLAGLGDPHLGRALARIHTEPGAVVTLGELAREARLSRSAFAERFSRVVGESPMRYLAGWRLDRARAELARGDEAIATISDRVGYASEAAFSRAFKRRHGMTPGAARRAERVAPLSARGASSGGG